MLAKAFGGLETAIGTVVSLSMMKNGSGFFNYDKNKGWSFGNIFKGNKNN